jgi:hypothetical protein
LDPYGTYLPTIAPRAPPDTLTEALLKARGIGQDIAQSSTEYNLTGSVVLAGSVGHGECGNVVGTGGSDGLDRAVLEVG